uniref:Uncharacterized protein n=1 Tax=Tanacetum cinerariifolium TaxID=118510 RepID=A0A699H0N9_TANCI|nr:hypothetical protein [Tanacetum cinerariifolium]
MAESSLPDITPKEEPITLDRPERPNPFLPVIQVEFTFEEIAFTTNNEVALLYPSHPNQEYFKGASKFISKCCLKKAFTRAPNQYKEYLSELWYTEKVLLDAKIWVSTPIGEVRGAIGITTFGNALRAQYLSHLSRKTGGLDQISNKDATILYCLENGVQVDYAKIIWEDLIHKLNKKTREKIVPYPSVHNWILKPNQPKESPFTDHMKAIYNLDVHVDSKAPKYSSPTEEVPQGKKPKARKSKSSLAMDIILSHPIPPTLVVGEMHKEAQQAAGGLTSLGYTSKNRTHPHLSSEFLDLPHLASLIQEKLKTFDSLPGLLKTVTNTLNRFATLVENASGAITTGVPLAYKATALLTEGEKDANTKLKNELVDFLGIDIVTEYYNKKLLYERLKFKFEEDDTLIFIQPPCYSVSKDLDTLKFEGSFGFREDQALEVFLKVSRSRFQEAEFIAHDLRDLLVKLVKKQLDKVFNKAEEE